MFKAAIRKPVCDNCAEYRTENEKLRKRIGVYIDIAGELKEENVKLKATVRAVYETIKALWEAL